MDGDSAFSVLMVCAANICRSPTAEALLRDELGHRKIARTLVVASGALGATSEMRRCVVAAKCLRVGGVDTATMLDESPRLLKPSDLDSADLLFASDQAISAGIIRLVPAVRTRLFTLREGAALAASLGSRTQLGPPSIGQGAIVRDRDTARARLMWLIAEMDGQRGRVSVPGHRFGVLDARRRNVPAYDIADVHGSARRQHRHMVAETSAAISIIMGQLACVVGESSMACDEE